jgi:excisionase family DNA binding protein
MSNPKTQLDLAAIRANPPVNLTLTEAAAYLAVSSKTLARELHDRNIRAARVRGCLVFQRAELDRYVAVKIAAA